MLTENSVYGIQREQEELIESVINILSYTEIKASLAIWEALEGKDSATLVMSSLADKYNFTRTSIVNAIRKLACARILNSQSLGVKGTFINILNRNFFEHLERQNRCYH